MALLPDRSTEDTGRDYEPSRPVRADADIIEGRIGLYVKITALATYIEHVLYEVWRSCNHRQFRAGELVAVKYLGEPRVGWNPDDDEDVSE